MCDPFTMQLVQSYRDMVKTTKLKAKVKAISQLDLLADIAICSLKNQILDDTTCLIIGYNDLTAGNGRYYAAEFSIPTTIQQVTLEDIRGPSSHSGPSQGLVIASL